MDAPLHNVSNEKLADVVEENLYALFCSMAGILNEGELIENDKFSRHLTFPHNPMFKGVWRTHLSSNEVDEVIDDAIGAQ
jgi:hypothetical protein